MIWGYPYFWKHPNHEHQHFWIQMRMELPRPMSWNKEGFPPQQKKHFLPMFPNLIRVLVVVVVTCLESKTHGHNQATKRPKRKNLVKRKNHRGWSCGSPERDAFHQYTSIRIESWSLLDIIFLQYITYIYIYYIIVGTESPLTTIKEHYHFS